MSATAEHASHPLRAAAPKVWNAVAIVAAASSGILIPYGINMRPGQVPLGPWVDAALTAIFAADLVFGLSRLKTRLKMAGEDETRQVLFRSLPRLLSDVLGVLPFARLTGMPLLELLRVFKVLRLGPLLRVHRSGNPLTATSLRLAGFALWVVLAVHWLSCGWLALHKTGHEADDARLYLDALYWCITTLTAVGYGDIVPVTAIERVFTMVVMVLGVGVYGYIIGNFANMLVKTDMLRAEHNETLVRLAGFLRYRNVPANTQKRIFDYYEYLWERRMGFDESKVLDELPPSLREELSLILKEDLIHQVPFLREASPRLVREISSVLRPVVYTPGDIVIRRGQRGNRMFFVGRGELEVLDRDESAVIHTFREGDFFGELALLGDQPRNATVRSVNHCDLYVLDRHDFEDVVTRHPEFAEHVHEVAKSRSQTPDESGA